MSPQSGTSPKIYTESEFNTSGAWGLYSAIDVHHCDLEKLTDGDVIKQFTIELCDRLNVKRYGDLLMYLFGDAPGLHGWSTAQMIETSLVSGHFIQESKIAYVDIFSCKYYDAQIIIDFAVPFFGGDSYDFTSILRVKKPSYTFTPHHK